MSSLADIMNTGGGTRKRTRTNTPQKPQSTPPQFDAGGVSEQPTQTAQAPQTPQVQGAQPAITAPEPPPISSWLKKEVPPTAEEAQQTAEQTEETPRRMSLEEIANHLYATNKPSPEEEERQRKRERSKAILAAIGDGVSALSNLYHTSKYAPDMSNPGSSLSDDGRKRYDRWKQVRKDNEEKYNNAILRARQGDYELNLKEREMLRKEAADAAKDAREAKRYEEQAKAKAEELRIRAEQAQNAKDKAAADAEYKKAQQEFNQRKLEAETALKKEQIAIQRATLAETTRYHSAQIALGRERNNISRSKGGGSKDTSGMYYLSGKHFTIGRQKQLSPQEIESAYTHSVASGWVNKKNQNLVENAYRGGKDKWLEAKLAVIGKLPTYTPQAKQYFMDNYGYTEIGSGKSGGFRHTSKRGKNLNLK
ncbi:hypothetical protein [Prevotella intermedia]|uniref:Uncharacterized protein n=1 Tax=Prevotella intermedia TaxID=28131 RepID=A0A2A6EFA7_PREIN|nr:hypothetical protein [Prevotella intermedia]PDP60149.1 hypothetical protein CLI71_06905 [Prevotella intermedia]